MKKSLSILIPFVLLTTSLFSQNRIFPVLQNAGQISEVPFAVDKPDTKMVYKIIAQSGDKATDSSEVSDAFDMVARMYNLHIYGGVKPDHLNIDEVVYAKAVITLLTDEAYKAKYGIENPNTKVIAEMKKAGIKIYACGQSINKLKIKPEDINPDVIISISRLTTVSTHMMDGYGLLSVD